LYAKGNPRVFQVSNQVPGRLELTLSRQQVEKNGDHKKQFTQLLTQQLGDKMDTVSFSDAKTGKRLNGKQAVKKLVNELDAVASHEQAHARAAGVHADNKIHFGFKQDKNTGLWQVTDGSVAIKKPRFDLGNLAETAKNYMQVATAALAPSKLKGQKTAEGHRISDDIATPSKADQNVYREAKAMAHKAQQLAAAQGQSLSITA
jgi:hypothetical protein